MNRMMQIDVAKLHELLNAVARRSFDVGYQQGRSPFRKDADPSAVKVSKTSVLALDPFMKKPKRTQYR